MPSTLEDFQLSTTAAADDFIVGYDTAALDGERRWTVSTLANAVSGIMNAQLDADIANATNVTVLSASLSASPMVAKAWCCFSYTSIGITIHSKYNIESITMPTRIGNANTYIINFSSPMKSSNYCVFISQAHNPVDNNNTGYNHDIYVSNINPSWEDPVMPSIITPNSDGSLNAYKTVNGIKLASRYNISGITSQNVNYHSEIYFSAYEL